MIAVSAARGSHRVTPAALLALGALALGLLYPLSAFVVNPLALPALLVLMALAAVSLSRPEVGVAVALVLVALNPWVPVALGLEALRRMGGGGLVFELAESGIPPAGLETPHPWAAGLVWTTLLFAITVWRLVAGQDRAHQGLPPLAIVSVTFLAVALASLAIARTAGEAVPLLRTTVTGLMLFFTVATQVRTRAQVAWVVGGIGVTAALIGGFATWEHVTGATSSEGFLTSTGELVYRVTAGFGQPNQLGGFLLILVPLTLAGALVDRRHRSFYLVATAFAVVGIYASFSRAALIALAVVPLVLLRGRHALVVLPMLAAASLLLMPDLLEERFETLNSDAAELASRVDFWRAAGAVWETRPALGVGIGNFARAYAEARVPGKTYLPDTIFQPPPHAHNLLLNLLAEQGLLGLLSFLAVIVVAVAHGLRLRRSQDAWVRVLASGILAALAGCLVHNLFDVTLLESTGIYFWALLGLLSALATIAADDGQRAEGPDRSRAGHRPG